MKIAIFGYFEKKTVTSGGYMLDCTAPEFASELLWPALTNVDILSTLFIVCSFEVQVS